MIKFEIGTGRRVPQKKKLYLAGGGSMYTLDTPSQKKFYYAVLKELKNK